MAIMCGFWAVFSGFLFFRWFLHTKRSLWENYGKNKKPPKNRTKTAQNRQNTSILEVWRFFKFSMYIFWPLVGLITENTKKLPKNSQKPPKTAQKPPFWRFFKFPICIVCQISQFCQQIFLKKWKTPRIVHFLKFFGSAAPQSRPNWEVKTKNGNPIF